MAPLISPDNVLAVLGILFAVVALALFLERRHAWAKSLSAALLALLGGLALSNAGVLPFASPAYDFLNQYFILVAIPLLLFKADLRVILTQGGRVLLAFLVAATGIVAGAVIAFLVIDVPRSAQYAAMLVGGYTGGGLNFFAVSQAVGVDDAAFGTAALAAETLAGISYLFLLALAPGAAIIRRWLPLRGPEMEAPGSEGAAGVPGDDAGDGADRSNVGAALGADAAEAGSGSTPSDGGGFGGEWPLHVAGALGMSLLVCATGVWLAAQAGEPRYAILVVTALAVAVATAMPRRMARLKGEQELGMLLLYVFFAAYTAAADLRMLLGAALPLLAYAFLVILVQVAASALGARIFRFSYAEILTASNACVLGPPTAAALAAGRGWHGLVTPGILTGVFGYVAGNFLGVSVHAWLS